MGSIRNTLRRLLGLPPVEGNMARTGGSSNVESRRQHVPGLDDDPLHPSRVPEGVKFRRPWHAANGSAHRELWGECGPQHPLYHVQARVVAARQDCDDFLFELFGGNAPAAFAVVHLTWGPYPDPHPSFPSTALYTSFEEWVAECMIPEAEEWGDEEYEDEDEEDG
jgi:hypothetical protein